jgi:hypothetical protein
MLVVVGLGLEVASVLHTCEAIVPTPPPADADQVRLALGHATDVDIDCAACVLSSHFRSTFVAGDVAIMPPLSEGLVQPVGHAVPEDARFRNLSARSPPTLA